MNKPAEDPKLLAELEAVLAASSMIGQWQYDENLERAIGGPKPSGVPYIWRWQAVQEKLLAACKAMPESKTARRTLAFLNPGLPKGGAGTTHTLIAAMQMVLPGELAWAHRHSIAALRFCVQGARELYTVVDGERLPMETHDLILTPAWCWHDHHNDSDKPGIWLDVLDLPIVMGMAQISYEKFGESSQPIREGAGKGGARPLRFAWAEMEQRLAKPAQSEESAYKGVFLEYQDPETGSSALPSISCNIQMLKPGLQTQAHRSTSSAVCLVLEGEGTTAIGGEEISWGKGDLFALPQWMGHRHLNRSKSGRAVLFVVTDAPLLKAMGIYREEAA